MARQSILIVEDQEILRRALQETLVEAGYRVLTAEDGRDANRMFAYEQMDLVLTDLLMPDRDGIEVITDLRRSRPDLPVVAMSGGGCMSAHYYLKLARSLGAKAVLQKPFSHEELLRAVALALPVPATGSARR
jgi:CheY-like chemotaxis protein